MNGQQASLRSAKENREMVICLLTNKIKVSQKKECLPFVFLKNVKMHGFLEKDFVRFSPYMFVID